MSDNLEFMWSNTDYPYACLLDIERTEAFHEAINATVRPGDIVLEVGAGTGILSLFAAQAGAKKVYAAEIDPLLVRTLHSTIAMNGYQDVIEVVEGDVLQADLPQGIDVVIGEMIETGLLDEMQIKVMNHLHEKQVIKESTKLIPQAYETQLQLVGIDNNFYGFKIAAPMHNWPFYNQNPQAWAPLKIEAASDVVSSAFVDFRQGAHRPNVQQQLVFTLIPGVQPNAIKISGLVHLADSQVVGAYNTLNGDKILPLELDSSATTLMLDIAYEMGGGLVNFRVSQALGE